MKYNKELEDVVLYHLSKITESLANIQVAIEKGLHLSEYYDRIEHFNKIEEIDQLFADLSDIAILYKITQKGDKNNG